MDSFDIFSVHYLQTTIICYKNCAPERLETVCGSGPAEHTESHSCVSICVELSWASMVVSVDSVGLG